MTLDEWLTKLYPNVDVTVDRRALAKELERPFWHKDQLESLRTNGIQTDSSSISTDD